MIALRMLRQAFTWCLALGLGSAPAAAAEVVISRVDVFVSDTTPIAAGTEAQALAGSGALILWNLDDLEHFNTRMAKNLPRDLERAKRALAARVAALTPAEQAALAHAATGVSRADGFHVRRLPAVLINEAYLYYGPRNIEEALAAYRATVEKQASLPERAP
jgi:integrating conjugative element protein (TIGR03757 family)